MLNTGAEERENKEYSDKITHGGGEVRASGRKQEQFFCNCSPVPDTYG